MHYGCVGKWSESPPSLCACVHARKSKGVGDEAGERCRPELHDFIVKRKIGILHCRQQLQLGGELALFLSTPFSFQVGKTEPSPYAPPLPSLTSHHQPQPGCLLSPALLLVCALAKSSLFASQLTQLVSVLSWFCLLKRLVQVPTPVSVTSLRN